MTFALEHCLLLLCYSIGNGLPSLQAGRLIGEAKTRHCCVEKTFILIRRFLLFSSPIFFFHFCPFSFHLLSSPWVPLFKTLFSPPQYNFHLGGLASLAILPNSVSLSFFVPRAFIRVHSVLRVHVAFEDTFLCSSVVRVFFQVKALSLFEFFFPFLLLERGQGWVFPVFFFWFSFFFLCASL